MSASPPTSPSASPAHSPSSARAHDHAHHDHDHDHGHAHSHHHGLAAATDPRARRALTIALVLTAGFAGVEFVASWKAGSLSLAADAWHMVSDSIGLAAALFAAVLASRPPTVRVTYGWRRAEVLAALGNGVLLGVAGITVALEAIERFGTPRDVRGVLVVGVGGAGLAVNLVAALVLYRASRDNHNVRAALAHVAGDALGSVAAIVAGLIVWKTGDTRADPILGFGVAALLLHGAFGIVRDATHILLEGTPPELDLARVEAVIRAVPGVGDVHDLHAWCIAPDRPALTAHVVLASPTFHGISVARAVGEALERECGLHHVTIQPEAPAASIVTLRSPRAH